MCILINVIKVSPRLSSTKLLLVLVFFYSTEDWALTFFSFNITIRFTKNGSWYFFSTTTKCLPKRKVLWKLKMEHHYQHNNKFNFLTELSLAQLSPSLSFFFLLFTFYFFYFLLFTFYIWLWLLTFYFLPFTFIFYLV